MLKGHLPRVIYHQVYWYTQVMRLLVGFGTGEKDERDEKGEDFNSKFS